MSILEYLVSLGFTNSTVVGEAKGVTTVRIRTDKGWAYERFASNADVDTWAHGKKPE